MSAQTAAPPRFARRFADSLILFVLLLLIWQAGYAVVGDSALSPPLTAFGFAVSLLTTADF